LFQTLCQAPKAKTAQFFTKYGKTNPIPFDKTQDRHSTDGGVISQRF